MLKGVLGAKVQLREDYFSVFVQHHRAIRDTSELYISEWLKVGIWKGQRHVIC